MVKQRQNVAGIDGESIGESIANRWEGLEDGGKNGQRIGQAIGKQSASDGKGQRMRIKTMSQISVAPECLHRERLRFILTNPVPD